jgi:hypothetical protein
MRKTKLASIGRVASSRRLCESPSPHDYARTLIVAQNIHIFNIEFFTVLQAAFTRRLFFLLFVTILTGSFRATGDTSDAPHG